MAATCKALVDKKRPFPSLLSHGQKHTAQAAQELYGAAVKRFHHSGASGEILREDILPALPMSKTSVAGALGISRQTLYDILNEKQPVTAEMAVRFGKLFGNGAAFWVNLQRNHDLALAERMVDVSGIPTLEVQVGNLR